MLILVCILLTSILAFGVLAIAGIGYLVFDHVRRWRNGWD